ncbi:hypothetical protein B0H13DRAFT_2311260 [Mycena leptocephala]|nr:hypothetical protein B0H13DRAFT_2311260 [Mycena leptocephala]
MAVSRRGIDLKAVGKIFHDTMAAIQNDTPTIGGLKPQAVEWLKAARYKLMHNIEMSYYQLEQSRNTPLTRPPWMSSGQPLYLQTNTIPELLNPYKAAFCANLGELLKASGFEHNTVSDTVYSNAIYIAINFPAQAVAVAARQAQEAPKTLHVEDEFSRAAKGKGRAEIFAQSKLGRLLIDARGESAAAGSAAGTNKKRRRGVKEEESDDNADVKAENDGVKGRQLRSVTRASSTVTLRSVESSRRGGRKRVKQQQ